MWARNIKKSFFLSILLFASATPAYALDCPALGCDDIGTLSGLEVYTHTRQVTGLPFVDIYNFSLGASAGDITLGVTNVRLFDTFDLYNLNLAVYDGFDGSGALRAYTGTQYQLALGQGDYSAVVSGLPIGSQGGIYTFVATVPLPASSLLLLSGLVATIGGAIRTRRCKCEYAAMAP